MANKIYLALRQKYTLGTTQLQIHVELSGSTLTFGTQTTRKTPHALIQW